DQLFLHSFEVTFHIIQLYFERSLQPINIILAFDSLFNLVVGVLNFVLVLLLDLGYCPNKALIVFWEMFSGIQKWDISLICMFFFLKVVPGKKQVFLRLKRHFSKVVLAILLTGCVFSLCTSILTVFWEENFCETAPPSSGNISYSQLPYTLTTTKAVLKLISYTIVFTIMVFTSGALMIHLVRHVKKMGGNNSELKCPSQHGVARAAVLIFFLALEYAICASLRHSFFTVTEMLFCISVQSVFLLKVILDELMSVWQQDRWCIKTEM
uniref:Taste receptor type 2 n=1 Tax=Scleropages formosus TaxID=113540 RepID=A0A8C9V060_SCLFO